ncbi:MAG: hypothetical protein U9Q22_06345 [Candidatus Altiarchaeota archaeon]|nr:hypothetical protein [Candidatus Altiarchaeota archaeon]
MKSKKIDLEEFDKLSVKEQYKVLGVRGIPNLSWRKEVRNLSAVELIQLHRKNLGSHPLRGRSPSRRLNKVTPKGRVSKLFNK